MICNNCGMSNLSIDCRHCAAQTNHMVGLTFNNPTVQGVWDGIKYPLAGLAILGLVIIGITPWTQTKGKPSFFTR